MSYFTGFFSPDIQVGVLPSGTSGLQLFSRCTGQFRLQNQLPSTISSIISHIFEYLSKDVVW
ncbi:MAG: hypothetical protein ACFFGP_16740, partial [Promethearchaeota archaeon]